MKTTIKILIFAFALTLLSFNTEKLRGLKNNSMSVTFLKNSIKWKSTEINLGEIAQSKPVTITFEFTNTGENPVIISSVQASCGCTSTDFVKTPILPGESTKIKAVFNAAVKGVFKKQVTVITNADETPQALIFTGTVI